MWREAVRRSVDFANGLGVDVELGFRPGFEDGFVRVRSGPAAQITACVRVLISAMGPAWVCVVKVLRMGSSTAWGWVGICFGCGWGRQGEVGWA